MKTFYVYRDIDGRRQYLGAVKVPNGKKALRLAHDEHGDLPLDVIGKKYVQDRKLGTMRGPAKK